MLVPLEGEVGTYAVHLESVFDLCPSINVLDNLKAFPFLLLQDLFQII